MMIMNVVTIRPVIGRIVAGGFVLLCAAALIISNTARASSLCETLVQDALKRLDESCSTLERNEACYGNDAIHAEMNDSYKQAIFDKVGDIVPLKAIRELYTLPLDTNSGSWGISLMKAQANLPDTMPGQNIMFVLYGDTHLTNTDTEGHMSAFYFSSGLGEPACKAVPSDGITIRSPKGMRVQFTANGVTMDIGSTVVLQASPNKAMQVQLVEGSAKITANNSTAMLVPGQSVTIPLGGTNGLQAVGTPSVPVNNPESDAHQHFMDAIDQTVTPTPTNTLEVTPTPTLEASQTNTAEPTFTSTLVGNPTNAVEPTRTPKPPKPTDPPKPTKTPKPPKPTDPPNPTKTPKPPKPTDPPEPSRTPKPPKPTDLPEPTKTPKTK